MSKQEKAKQLKLKLSYSPFSWLFTTKEKLKKSLLIFEMNKFSNDLSPWIQISYLSSLFILSLYYIAKVYGELPLKIPLIKIFEDLSVRLVPKEYFFLILGLVVILDIIIIRFGYLLYDKDRTFVTVLLLINTIVNTFLYLFLINTIINYIYV